MRVRLPVLLGLTLTFACFAHKPAASNPWDATFGRDPLRRDPASDLQRQCRAAVEANRFEDAVQRCTEAIEKEPGIAAAYLYRGLARMIAGGSGNSDLALVDFDKAIQLDPRNAVALSWKGNALFEKGQLEAAVAAYDRSIDLAPDPVTILNRGRALASLGQSDRALADFRTVERSNRPELASSLGSGYVALARTLTSAGRYDDALAAIDAGMKAAAGEPVKGTPESASLTSDLNRERALVFIARGEYRAASEFLGSRPLVGIEIRLNPGGIEVTRANKGAPADLAGIRAGDILTEFNGVPLAGMEPKDFSEKIVATAPFGSAARVKLLRADRTVETNIVVGVFPDLPARSRAALAVPAAAAPLPGPSLEIRGIETSPATIRAGSPSPYDVMITLIARDQAAGAADLPVSFVCSISRDGKILHETKPETVQVPNGQARTIVKHLRAVDGKGLFTLKVSLRFGNKLEERSLDLRID